MVNGEVLIQPRVISGLTSVPSRLDRLTVTLQSISAQTRRPDELIISLPRVPAARPDLSLREYAVPAPLAAIISEHSWMHLHWLDSDDGPGSKLLGVISWLATEGGAEQPGDVVIVLDDDQCYDSHAFEDGVAGILEASNLCVGTFFAYHFRSLIVPQGADLLIIPLIPGFGSMLLSFHQQFVDGDEACFFVDDLWLAIFFTLCGYTVQPLRAQLQHRGLGRISIATANADVDALGSLAGKNSRHLVMVRAFDSLTSRLSLASSDEMDGLSSLGGAPVVQ